MAVFKLPKSELSTYDKLVYAVLCGHSNRDGNAKLYVRTIATEASCSERQARRALSNLEAHRLLVRRSQSVEGQGQTFNIYEVYGFDEYAPCDALGYPDESAQGDGTQENIQENDSCEENGHFSENLPVTPVPMPVSHTPPDCPAELYNLKSASDFNYTGISVLNA
jgi:hypothetical protein